MSQLRARRTRFGGHGRVAGLVLAGGRGQRAGGVDKGLLRERGEPLAQRALTTLAPCCDVLVVSANRNRDRYALLADVVVADRDPAWLGPLAGLSAAQWAVRAPWWLVCPCDVANLPADVPQRLLRALRLNAGAQVAVLHDAERLQPLVMALRGGLHAAIERYLQAGGRSVHGWLAQQPVAVVRTPGVVGNRNQSL